MKKLIITLACSLLIAPSLAFGEATLISDTEVFEKAKVLEVISHSSSTIPGSETPSETQTLRIEVLTGKETGKKVTFQNDYIQLTSGDTFLYDIKPINWTTSTPGQFQTRIDWVPYGY